MDDLALLGDLDLGVSRTRRLRQDRLVRRAAAATDRAATTVEDPKRPAMSRHHGGDRLVGAVERPGRAHVANLFVAIGISEHHLLDPAPPIELSGVRRVGEQGFQRCRRALQGIASLEQRDNVDLTARRRGPQVVEAGKPGEEQRVEDVIRARRHADDEGLCRPGCGPLGLPHRRQGC